MARAPCFWDAISDEDVVWPRGKDAIVEGAITSRRVGRMGTRMWFEYTGSKVDWARAASR
jgi:hypothetical protein